MSIAHVFGAEERTQDVHINEEITFEGLILSESTLKGLMASGFERPSPIQLVAIPLGKCGFDLIAEAKSGTGKTVMFGVIALEMIKLPSKSLQVLVLTPTREIAAQVGGVLNNIGQNFEDLHVGVFIGGLSVHDDRTRAKNCHIAVGTPGRLKHLIDDKLLDVSHIRLIVIDEADKLLEPSFEPDISYIFKSMPINKQVIASSATYTPDLKRFLEDYMRSPIRVNPDESNADKSDAILLGVRQIAALVPYHANYLMRFKNKLNALVSILSSVPFKQCIVFNNSHAVAQTISQTLNGKGWPTEFISSSMDQPTRLRVVNTFVDYKCRILLSTDLVSRGIDVANVNLVVNLDVPMTSATYLHRVGRSGRYGTQGLAITLVESDSKDLIRLVGFVKDINIPMDCIKISSATAFTEDLFVCSLPTLLSQVPDASPEAKIISEEKIESEIVSASSIEDLESDTESIKSSCSELQEMPSDSDVDEKGNDLPSDMCKMMESVKIEKQQEANGMSLEDEVKEMHRAASGKPLEQVTPQKLPNWRQHDLTSPKFDHNTSPRFNRSSERYNQNNGSPRFNPGNTSPRFSPGNTSPRFNHIDNFQHKQSPSRSLNFSSPYTSPRMSPMCSRREFTPNSSQHSTPRKEFHSPDYHKPAYGDKFVFAFAKFSETFLAPDFTKKFDNPVVPLSPSHRQYYQDMFENALHDLLKDLRTYEPAKLDRVSSYDELEAMSKRFEPTSRRNPAFDRREPYFNKKAILLGMNRQLGVHCNVAKRQFAFNGGVKSYLEKLAAGYEPKDSDLPLWEPGPEGFKISRNAWVLGHEEAEKLKREALEAASMAAEPSVHAQKAVPPPKPPRHSLQPRPPFVSNPCDGGQLTVPPPPTEHHTLTFPAFPTQPGASLDEWKEQVKQTTFMIHYAEYFRMMNKK